MVYGAHSLPKLLPALGWKSSGFGAWINIDYPMHAGEYALTSSAQLTLVYSHTCLRPNSQAMNNMHGTLTLIVAVYHDLEQK